MKYKVLLQKWSRVCSALPGCWSQVATEEETLELDIRLGKDWRWLINGYSRAKPTTTAIAL